MKSWEPAASEQGGTPGGQAGASLHSDTVLDGV